jgi:hypothetical protein
MWANGDNLALLPWFVDAHLEFKKAVHVRIKGRTQTQIDVDYLDAALEYDASGQLKWLGRVRKWTLQPKQATTFTFSPGRDVDGDFMMGQDGVPGHWRAEDVNTGRSIDMD